MDFKEPNKNLYKNTVRHSPRPHTQKVVRLTPSRCCSAVRAPQQDARAVGTSQASQSAGIAGGRAVGISRADWHGLTRGTAHPPPIRGAAAHQVQRARLPIPPKRLKLTRAVRHAGTCSKRSITSRLNASRRRPQPCRRPSPAMVREQRRPGCTPPRRRRCSCPRRHPQSRG
jgi:hypothetical protein